MTLNTGETNLTDTIEILEHLVGFDTTSHKSNADLVDWVCQYLSTHGVESERIVDTTGEKFNIRATIGPDASNGIVMSGHTDVVPVEGQVWETDPFKLTEKDGKLYGRGSADMKGFLACVLAAVPAITQAQLSRPIHIAFSYDEETGGLGVPDLIDRLAPAAAVIVGEPTLMKVVDRHKGCLAQNIVITGVPAHSSLPELGVSAIEYAGQVISEIYALGEWLKTQTNQSEEPGLGRSTVSVGTVSGGTAHNIIAEHCELVWQLRCAPGQDANPVLDRFHEKVAILAGRMKQANSACSIVHNPLFDVPQFTSANDTFARDLCLQVTGDNQTIGVNYGTEAGFFTQSGYSTIVCGPGSIDQAHKENEFIELAQLQQCDAFLEKIIHDMAK